MTYADYRPHLPSPGQSRIAGDSAEAHAQARLSTPRAQSLFAGWEKLATEPFSGISTTGTPTPGLFHLQPEGAPAECMCNAATALLGTMTKTERQQAHIALDSPHWRHWQNTEIINDAHGLRLQNTSAATRARVLDLLRASLSDRGYDNALAVMQLNGFLGQLLNAEHVLSEWAYNLCLYGDPHLEEPWGWQLWGHHLAMHCVLVGGQMVLTPCFMGAEICYADTGPWQGLSLFQDHEKKGLELMRQLPATLQNQARVGLDLAGSDLPDGRVHFADYRMLGGAYQDNRIVPYEGAVAADFNPGHQQQLLDLVEAYIGNLPSGPKAAKMRAFEEHLEDTHFCWIGGHGPDDPFYYRIQSPITFIEFDHHPGLFLTNTEALKFHVHTVVRTPNGNDYGIDVLRQHYREAEHAHGTHDN